MRDQILSNIQDAGQLENLYRQNKSDFKKEFSALYPQLSGKALAQFWHERLTYEADEISWGSKQEFLFIIVSALMAGLLAKLPAFIPVNAEFFYPRNIAFLVFPFLTAYFAWKNKLPATRITFISAIMVICLAYVNLLPNDNKSDTLILACIHLPLLLWALFGLSFLKEEAGNFRNRLSFLRFNGDLLVMSALLVLSGILMTGITLGLFELIDLKVEKFYFEYVVIFGLPAVPIIAAYLNQTNPHLVNKVSPVIARIFSPIVLVMLVIYLGAIIFSGKDLYTDREFLLLFNLLLAGVMALIFFSVAEDFNNEKSLFSNWILRLLSVVTMIVNCIALSAIIFRISEWGITPNRLAVLGANVLMLLHLLLVTVMLLKTSTTKTEITAVGRIIVRYLPVYIIWAGIVVFIFPVIFGFE